VTIASARERVVCGGLDEDAGYRTVRPGGTTDWVLFVTLAGRGRLRRPGVPDTLATPHRIAVIEPHVPHDYGTDPDAGRWSLRWAHIEPPADWLPLLDWPNPNPNPNPDPNPNPNPALAPDPSPNPSPVRGIRSIEVDDTVHSRIVQALDRAISARRSGLGRDLLFAMNAVEEALLWCDTQNPHNTVLDPRLLAVLEYVGAHLDRPHTAASLARVAGLSPSRLAHLAAAQLGTSLMAHVERRRMELAQQLLAATDLPIAHIARRAGFSDPFYFSRRFRTAVAMAPSEFRASVRRRSD
jgi:AraC family transcriptional regulator of arabinose operon